MKHSANIISATVIVFFVVIRSLTAFSQNADAENSTPPKSSQEAALQSIVSTNGTTRLNAAIQLDRKREELIQQLISVLASSNADVVKIEAVIVLGEYRAEEAVPILVEHFEWDDAARGGFFNGRIPKEEAERKLMPVSFALKKIGMAAVPALLDKLSKADNEKLVRKSVVCCCLIEGKDIIQKRLEDRLKSEPDSDKAKKFESALQILNQLKVDKAGSIIANW